MSQIWFHLYKHNLILEWDQILFQNPVECNNSINYSWNLKTTSYRHVKYRFALDVEDT